MIGFSSSPCSCARSRAAASPRPRANSACPSPRCRAPSRRSSVASASNFSSAPPGKSRPPMRARRCSRAARDALLAIDEAESAARGADHLSGLLRVALPPEYGVRRIVPLLPAFFARHPLLKIDLMMSDRYENLIAEGADLALRIGDLPDSSFVARKLESAQAPVRRLAVLSRSPRHARESRRSCTARPHQRPGRRGR